MNYKNLATRIFYNMSEYCIKELIIICPNCKENYLKFHLYLINHITNLKLYCDNCNVILHQ